jgi:hypothetical protein
MIPIKFARDRVVIKERNRRQTLGLGNSSLEENHGYTKRIVRNV